MFKDFQVMMISKDVSNTCKFIKKETLTQVFSCKFCKLFKNTFLYRTNLVAPSDNTTFTTEPMKQQINTYNFFVRSLFYRKWKIKNAVVLDVRSAAHLINQGVLFLACLQCFKHVQRHARAIVQSSAFVAYLTIPWSK